MDSGQGVSLCVKVRYNKDHMHCCLLIEDYTYKSIRAVSLYRHAHVSIETHYCKKPLPYTDNHFLVLKYSVCII